MAKSFKFYIYLSLLLLLLLPLFTNSVQADTYWAANGNDIYNTNTDQVGIGTNTPSQKLEIVGGSASETSQAFINDFNRQSAIYWGDNTNSWDIALYRPASSRDLRIYGWQGGSGDRVTFTSAGSVGIGTTSPDVKLDVSSTASEIVTMELGTEASGFNNGGSLILKGAGGADLTKLTSTYIDSGTDYSRLDIYGYLQSVGNQNVMSILGNGSVGIGTTSPDVQFEVEGNNNVLRLTDTNDWVGMGLNAANGYRSSLYFQEAGTDKYEISWEGGSDYLKFYGEGVTDMVIKSDGKVGIGETSPAAQLHLGDIYEGAGRNLQIGNEMYLSDIDADRTLGVYSAADGAGKIKFGSDGATVGSIDNSNAFRVDATLIAKEIYVQSNVWADYVFSEDYHLRPLSEVESYISENGHLPDVPSEEQIASGGINVAEMDRTLLQKVEELTLYTLDLKKENEELKARLDNLENVCR